MLTDLENSILNSIQELAASIPANFLDAKPDDDTLETIRFTAAALLAKLVRESNEVPIVSKEFFMAYMDAMPPVMYDAFLWGGLNLLREYINQ